METETRMLLKAIVSFAFVMVLATVDADPIRKTFLTQNKFVIFDFHPTLNNSNHECSVCPIRMWILINIASTMSTLLLGQLAWTLNKFMEPLLKLEYPWNQSNGLVFYFVAIPEEAARLIELNNLAFEFSQNILRYIQLNTFQLLISTKDICIVFAVHILSLRLFLVNSCLKHAILRDGDCDRLFAKNDNCRISARFILFYCFVRILPVNLIKWKPGFRIFFRRRTFQRAIMLQNRLGNSWVMNLLMLHSSIWTARITIFF